MVPLAVAVLAPIATGLVAAAGVWGRDWRERRNEDAVRRSELNEAISQMNAVETWARALSQTSELPSLNEQERKRAVEALDQAYRRAMKVFEARPPRKGPHLNLRVLFLTSLDSPGARTIRILYYLSLPWLISWAIVIATWIVKDLSFAGIWVGAIFLFVLAIGPTVALHALATALDKKGKARLKPVLHEQNLPPMPPAGALSHPTQTAPGSYPAGPAVPGLYPAAPRFHQPGSGAAGVYPPPSARQPQHGSRIPPDGPL